LSTGRGCGSDYLVPWHVPSHRPEAAAVAAAAAGDAQTGGGHDRGFAGASGHDPAHGAASGIVDAQKGTVVFQRYYHLFSKGELEQLAAPLPGAGSVRTFYDKDNWCLVMERM
jgi:alkylated DNA repair protein alkB family protein 8